ncbi:MAG: transposase [Atribacterota bacterium]|jgi:REP element-mobilizing transposase RayT|nr:transposase [Atribacterota bacterium]MDD4897080.1 transposase [Atribacterota bacterium]MDD5637252.1 transposase [Atribacterota bacterium]
MARPLRIEFPGAVYHITARGNAKQNIFYKESDFANFLTILCKVVKRYHFILHYYCLMYNHYHLLIETPEGNLSRGMRQLNGVYTQYFNKKHQRVGHLFQGRYKAILVEKENYLLELSRYISLNPVRANLVQNLEEWNWSAYRQFIGLSNRISCLSTDWILGQFGIERNMAINAYKNFILSGVDKKSPLQNIKGQIFLGSNYFTENVANLVEKHAELSEITRKQLYASRPSLQEIFQNKNNEKIQIEKEIYKAYQKYGYTLKEIAQYLSLHYTTISRIIKKVENK